MKWLLLALMPQLALAAVHSLTLQQCVELASQQNVDVLVSRLDAIRAREEIQVARDPFSPKLTVGSDLAYTSGYPNSINGYAPSILNARGEITALNRPRNFQVSAVRERARGAEITASEKGDDVAYNIGILYVDALQALKQAQTLDGYIRQLQGAVDLVQQRVNEGQALDIQAKRIRVTLLEAQQRMLTYRAGGNYAKRKLAVALGFSGNDEVEPRSGMLELPLPPMASENEAVQTAVANSKSVSQLNASLFAKQLEIRSFQVARYPQVKFIAQYAMFQRSVYEGYFPGRVTRNNEQLATSIKAPLLIGSAIPGQHQQAETDAAKLRLQISQLRNRIAVDTMRAYQQFRKAERSLLLSQTQQELSSDDLSQTMAQYSEGQRQPLDVATARTTENERALALVQSEAQVARTKLDVLHGLGDLMKTLQSVSNP